MDIAVLRKEELLLLAAELGMDINSRLRKPEIRAAVEEVGFEEDELTDAWEKICRERNERAEEKEKQEKREQRQAEIELERIKLEQARLARSADAAPPPPAEKYRHNFQRAQAAGPVRAVGERVPRYTCFRVCAGHRNKLGCLPSEMFMSCPLPGRRLPRRRHPRDGDDLLGGVREDAGSLAPSAVVELPDRGGAGQDKEDDAGSSASEATAVAAGLPGNLGGRIRERVREIENELSRFLSESSNKVPVPARNFIMSRVFELAAFCSDLREDAASERGAALALQGQLVETRREVAVLQRRVHEAESGLPGAVAADLSARRADAPGPVPAAPQGALSYAAVLAGPGAAAGGPRLPGREPAGEVIPEVRQEQHQHVAFLTPTSQTAAPARDVLRLLKTNIDPASKGIKDVTLRHTRYGLTVFSNREESIKNMQQAIQENTVTRQMIIVRVPGRRNPHVRFSGVDPDKAGARGRGDGGGGTGERRGGRAAQRIAKNAKREGRRARWRVRAGGGAFYSGEP
ncbi:hypothetical protein HPB50_014591 [Hyalomma asiaticum]|uniref:Uncharacterized protein n=1 Tax=Hyalomma asiaticum TaxID=266040 RepID=A0ACB7T4G5_HYAAI|nr:hypothetical protein HPB50_014591 [Hyalomma asiaticum]